MSARVNIKACTNKSCSLESVLHTTPLQTAAWCSPLAVGGVILAISGGFVLHLIPNRVLMFISGGGFLVSVLLFALQPVQGPDGPSTSKLYWAWVFPAMCCGTIGVDITYNITNIYISTSMPKKSQATASGLINSVLYLAFAFWLGIAELAITLRQQIQGPASLREQYRIGFWLGVALAIVGGFLVLQVKMGAAEAAMTADEKAELARTETEEAQREAERVVAAARLEAKKVAEKEEGLSAKVDTEIETEKTHKTEESV